MLDLKALAKQGAAVSSKKRPRSVPVHALIRVWKSISADNVSLLAAGVAFYMLLAIFPGLVFIVAMLGLRADTAQIQQLLLSIKDVLPAEAWVAVNKQLLVLMRQNSTSLSLASIFSVVGRVRNASTSG